MKKLRKRVFAVVLAALMLVTAMPVTALYASAETGDVIEQAETGEASGTAIEQAEMGDASGTAIEQAEMEDTEKKETDNTEEAETGGSTDKPETGDGDTEEQETIAVKPTQELPADIPKEDIKACICEMPCTEGSINGDCPVCGAEGADFSSCEGEKIENSSGEDAGYDDVDTENTIVDLIAALPDAVTADNADEVRAQLDEILALYQELTEEEQEQIDISRCLELQEALEAANAPAPVEEEPDLELFGQGVRSGDSGDGWSYADGVLTLENFHAEDSGVNFIHITNALSELTLYVKGDNSVKTSGSLFYGGSTTITGDQGASLSLEGGYWNDRNISIRGVNVDVITQGMIFIVNGMVIDNATVSFNMSGSNGYIYTTHSGFTVKNGSNVTITNSSGNVDYCVATNKTEITDSVLNITNPSGFGVYVTKLSQQPSEYKASVTNSTISAAVLDAAIHCEEEVSVINSQITGSGQFLIRSKKGITVDGGSTMEGITYEFFKSGTGAAYQVYGSHTLTADLTVAEEGSLIIPEGAALTIPHGITMKNNGTMRIHDKTSLTGAGALTGNGDFLIDVNEDMIFIPEGLAYTGKDYTDQITLEGTTTIFGVEFTADTEGWTRNIEPAVVKDAGDYTVTFTKGDKTISKVFKVAECPHTGLVYEPLAGGGHGGICPLCNEKIAEEHKWTDGVCSVCSVKAVARMEKGGAVIGYLDVRDFEGVNGAFFNDTYAGMTVVLLDDIAPASDSTTGEACSIAVNINCTLDLNGYKITGTDIAVYILPMGNLTIQDSSTDKTGQIISNTNAAFKNDGNATLKDGTYIGNPAIKTEGNMSAILPISGDTRYTFFDASGNAVSLTEWQNKTELSGPVTVKACKHAGVEVKDLGGGKHGLTCPYCGDKDEHETRLIAAADQTTGTVTVHEGCDTEGCGYNKPLGSAVFTFENLAYKNPDAKVSWVKDGPAVLGVMVKIDNAANWVAQSEEAAYSCSLTKPDAYAGTPVTAGEHTMKVLFYDDSSIIGAQSSNECELTFTVAPAPLTAGMVMLDKTEVTYNGQPQQPALAVRQGENLLTEETDYEVSYTRDGDVTADFTNVGAVAITVKGKGNYDKSTTVTKEYIITPATPAVTWSNLSQELTYTGNQEDIIKPMVTLVNNETFGGTIQYSYTGTTSGTGLPAAAGTYTIKAHVDAEGNYTAADSTNELTLTIKKAEGMLNVPASPIEKNFGGGEFSLNCTTNGDGKLSYTSSNENVASVSADGKALIKGAGETTITISLGEGTNHTGGASRTVKVIVSKAAAPAAIVEKREYTYTNGSNGAVTIDVSGKLPTDRGKTEYALTKTDDNNILSSASVDENGNLIYTVQGNKSVGDTASITVTAEMANYKDAAYTVEIKIVKKKVVEPQGEISISGSNTLTYGQALSVLKLGNVVFVEQGTGAGVEGTLAWKDSSIVPEAGTKTAEWIFTPADDVEYAELTGTVPITIAKATPNVEIPVAEAVTYNPSGTLSSVKLTGGSAAWTVGDSTVAVEGVWSWMDGRTSPTVGNSGYHAVFTPKDADNYNTVERDIIVTVEKAKPYIEGKVSAAQITYGDSLSKSALTGTAQYSENDGTPVHGSFTWKDGAIKPAVSDSGSTRYTVVFTPDDRVNYSGVETEITLIVEKAENVPNMPSNTLSVPRRCEKVGDVELPADWQWLEGDKDKALEIDIELAATAVYTGADKDNYKNVTAVVKITRSNCDHEKTELKNVVDATCEKEGYSGDTYCAVCGELLKKGSVTQTIDHKGGVASCREQAVCEMCKKPYGFYDANRHISTERRNAVPASCTLAGNTGDLYCTACGTKVESGRVIPASGHNWQENVIKQPTTSEEGLRRYTCRNCGISREETIPKLPSESHTHSYSQTETRAASCTETGIKVYSCSCGDSYTEGNPALGHSYRSQMTKAPTVSEEGVMTYTCTRCGHSYMAAISRLKATAQTSVRTPGTGSGNTERPGTGSTERPGAGAEPGSGTEQDTRPDTGIPFIKDEDGKIGWDVIRDEEEQAKDGSVINVDMNGTTVVPGDIFDSIKGRDITITFDMGNGILWSVDGKSITTNRAGDIDFDLKTGTSAIPVDIVNNVAGERYSLQISLAYEGEFGFTAVLSVNLGKENEGYTASLYYYNESTGELEFICADKVAEDGTASLAFTHASDYVIAIDGAEEEESGNITEPAQPEAQDEDSAEAEEESPQTGQVWRPLWFIVIGALVIIMGIGAFFVMKKGKDENNGQ